MGFTLVEFIIVLAIAAILAIIAVPALFSIVPSAQARASARNAAGLMQQGRILAENSQKPARVVLADCRGPLASAPHPCRNRALEPGVFNAFLETAAFDDSGAFDEWAPVGGESLRALARGVSVTATAPPVAGNPNGVFWAVFMPSGDLWASHNSAGVLSANSFMELEFKSARGTGWLLAVSRGRAALERME